MDDIIPPNNLVFQIARWRHNADWWSGKIIATISDKERAARAVEQVQVWTKRLVEN